MKQQPFSVYEPCGSKPVALQELQRLQAENKSLLTAYRARLREIEELNNRVSFFSDRYNDCAAECRGLHKELDQHRQRPAIDAPLWRRLRYLATGR